LPRCSRAGAGNQEVGESIVTQVESQEIADALERAALAASGDAVVTTAPLANVDWSEQWKKGFTRRYSAA
jgi:hypothetical protein